MKKLVLITLMLVTSCSTKFYQYQGTDVKASVSFSRLSKDIASIYIIDNCQASQVQPELIEDKYPSQKSKYKIVIPVNRQITFEYRYFWISGETSRLVSKSNGLTAHRIEAQTDKSVTSCRESITFVPEENKHYEVYFGKADNKCVIKAGEAKFSENGERKKVTKISELKRNNC